ncbi:hypothetical protein [Fretibacterium sp. OH1220_COT-178]|uniref:hypothetical protein n=1 Tax=Fretibacterium sp. OH1220_COT-178 TaxID=2491047 RepID=UPI000F5FAA27|nr:hypothetical protein [Fretibacterium sp. OH1220_COT-178]
MPASCSPLECHRGGVKVVLPGGSVTFRKARWFTGFHHPDAIVFADGTTWRWKDVAPNRHRHRGKRNS